MEETGRAAARASSAPRTRRRCRSAGTGSAGHGRDGRELRRAGRPRRLRRRTGCSASGWPTSSERNGAEVVRVEAEWGRAIPTSTSLLAARRRRSTAALFVVHGETSTGVCQPLDGLGELCREHDALFLVDCVTSLAGQRLVLDEALVDAAFSGTQKCLNCPPGLAPFTAGDARDGEARARVVAGALVVLRSVSRARLLGTPTAAAPTTTPRRSTWSTRCARRCGSSTRRGSRRGGSATPSRTSGCAARSGVSAARGSRPTASSCTRCSPCARPRASTSRASASGCCPSTASRSAAGSGPFAGQLWRIGVMGDGAELEPQQRLVARARRRARRGRTPRARRVDRARGRS